MILPVYRVRAVNDALTSENRIHSDAIARRFGFTGALCSGVSVFGYLVHPLVEAYGEDWLGCTLAEVRFLKPAYVDDVLTVSSELLPELDFERHHLTRATNANGTPLAELISWRPEALPPVNSLATRPPAEANPPRVEIGWEVIEPDTPAAAYTFRLSDAEHREKLDLLQEQLPLFRQGERPPLHPYILLKECNQALMRLFILPAWIHVSSKLVMRQVLRVGNEIEVRCIPVQKWERKGHQFIRLYITLLTEGTVALEVEHTAIFRIAT